MAKKILIAGKERSLSHFVSMELQKQDYIVEYAGTGAEAISLTQETDFDLLIVSYRLSDMTSTELNQQLSQTKPGLVMIVVLEDHEMKDHQVAIEEYAALIVIKPFIISDLIDQVTDIFMARDYIDEHCKQVRLKAAYRDLEIDFQHRTVSRNGQQINLTRREYDLLAALMDSQGVVSRHQLLDRVWKYEAVNQTNIVDVYVRYLRGKLDLPGKESYIQTVRGKGYVMREE
ncbi:winged helix-turn-helix transcriptional regulator [Streptococcus sp. DD13]|uniref:winged helix-turn-helix transcriptional regulator n=1 Tax=Streptococcus sp. DD13 TaxID=1777881 RepID=UPI000792C7AD|nr:response regulator transcription factor [Streptococcus sp. DD13]KXT78212.1 Response regulator CsrR [Streptococcus sp. DD13]